MRKKAPIGLELGTAVDDRLLSDFGIRRVIRRCVDHRMMNSSGVKDDTGYCLISLPCVSILEDRREGLPRRTDGGNRLPHHLEIYSQARPASMSPEQYAVPASGGPDGLSGGAG